MLRFLVQQVGVMLVDDLNGIAEPLGHAGGVARVLLEVLGGEDVADQVRGAPPARSAWW